ncbi:uncharacterized protein Z519_07745 [Cladophialophora bantiana CBS 173.52]|uniref:Fe2OG dioxygenase domain-containing protein n=1 Tax=Cladophialophora bantiana (strain ATCC 10958 / CBS 173.52 / CDC B-1940 / NIH 8579) TaxID=1442370 RepID=A0A0D2HLU9_CLAB1|nr:uncharacterized protein Z519_07745 [Cladophialophora bantiana CBS 173.52]KIW91775.1 hypothetical protein Z519_07745 [Cladophialophora bantiana CBS 173.52]
MPRDYNLSRSQIEQYLRDGYLHIPFEEHQIAQPNELQAWTNEVKSWPYESGKWLCYEEPSLDGKQQLFRTEAFVEYHPEFDQLLRGGVIGNILKQLSGDEMLLFKEKINYKLPNSNGFKAHLDAPAYDHIGRVNHLTVNIAVDEATVANGCLEVVPGSHNVNVKLAPGEGGRVAEDWEASAHWVSLPLKPGDIVLFGSHLAHRSAPNKTDHSRASVYATYSRKQDGTDLRERYYADRRATFPPHYDRKPGEDYGAGMLRYGFHYFEKSATRTAMFPAKEATTST